MYAKHVQNDAKIMYILMQKLYTDWCKICTDWCTTYVQIGAKNMYILMQKICTDWCTNYIQIDAKICTD